MTTGGGGPAPGPGDIAAEVSSVEPPLQRPTGKVARAIIWDELVRAALALLFTGILVMTILLSYTHLGGTEWNNTKDWLQALLPAETALLGSATGFYFGQRKDGNRTG